MAARLLWNADGVSGTGTIGVAEAAEYKRVAAVLLQLSG
jgi:hypothetical protein